MRILRFLLLLIWFAAVPPALADAVPLDGPRVKIGNPSQRAEGNRPLSIEDVTGPGAALFRPNGCRDGGIPLAVDGEAAWLRFTVQNPEPAAPEWWLEVDPAMNKRIDLYVPRPDGSHALRQAGAGLPFSVREVPYRNPVFKLSVPSGLEQTYYLRVDAGRCVRTQVTFWQPAAFLEAAGREQIGFGLYLGVYLLLVLASLWFEIAVRDRVYLYFGLYVSACILTTLTSTGLWQQYVLPDHPQWLEAVLAFSRVFLIGTCMQFLFRFVRIERQSPRVARYYLAAVWGLSALAFAAALAGFYMAALTLFGKIVLFGLVPSAFVLLLRPALRAGAEVRYAFAVSGIFLVFAYVYQSLANSGVLRPNAFTQNAMYISSMVFFLVVYYAISRSYNAMRLEKEAAQNEALRLSQRSERELESEVAARTDELRRAVQTVETALAQAQAVQQEQRHFISTVSHELRTPLAVIDATAQNLEREVPGTSVKGQARLKKIRQATSRLSMLFDDYLNDERFEEFAQGIDCREVALLPLLRDALEAAQSLADRHRLAIGAATPDLTVRADPKLLRLALRTLADNAVKYTPAGTSVTLTGELLNDGWRIDVADDGPGIPPDERKQVFERYYRGRASSGRIGTGLGLPLARRLIEMHGGTLQLVTADGGCTFRIWLPAG